jgi:hypothetical protein
VKKTITIERHHCDACGEPESYPTRCLRCDAEFCYDCSKDRGVRYQHAVFHGGSGDGFYCHDCDRFLRSHPQGECGHRHTAYLRVAQLKFEHDGWWRDFKARMETAEKALDDLRDD